MRKYFIFKGSERYSLIEEKEIKAFQVKNFRGWNKILYYKNENSREREFFEREEFIEEKVIERNLSESEKKNIQKYIIENDLFFASMKFTQNSKSFIKKKNWKPKYLSNKYVNIKNIK